VITAVRPRAETSAHPSKGDAVKRSHAAREESLCSITHSTPSLAACASLTRWRWRHRRGEFRLPVLMYAIGFDSKSAVPLNLAVSRAHRAEPDSSDCRYRRFWDSLAAA
jgi:hypothetical protein